MTGSCQVHPPSMRHQPRLACALDFHHVLPRDWQRAWTPPGAVVVTTAQYGAVWEPTGVMCPPTCHHNVHAGIVALTHAWQTGETAQVTLKRIRKQADAPLLDPAEWRTAARALELWQSHGGDVALLQAQRLWGNV